MEPGFSGNCFIMKAKGHEVRTFDLKFRQRYHLEPSSVYNIHRALSFRLKILDVEHLDLKKNGGLEDDRYH